MFSIKKCLVVALALTVGLIAVGECQAGYVFGKEPVARHNMAVAKKRLAAQAPRYRPAAPSYGAMAYRPAPVYSRSIASNSMVQVR